MGIDFKGFSGTRNHLTHYLSAITSALHYLSAFLAIARYDYVLAS